MKPLARLRRCLSLHARLGVQNWVDNFLAVMGRHLQDRMAVMNSPPTETGGFGADGAGSAFRDLKEALAGGAGSQFRYVNFRSQSCPGRISSGPVEEWWSRHLPTSKLDGGRCDMHITFPISRSSPALKCWTRVCNRMIMSMTERWVKAA